MDQCVHCVHKGNLDSCRNEDCGFHTLWFHLADKKAALKAREKELEVELSNLALAHEADRKPLVDELIKEQKYILKLEAAAKEITESRDEWKRQWRLIEAAEKKAEEQIATLQEETARLYAVTVEQSRQIAALNDALSGRDNVIERLKGYLVNKKTDIAEKVEYIAALTEDRDKWQSKAHYQNQDNLKLTAENKRLEKALNYIVEYWNGHENPIATLDAANMARDIARDVLKGKEAGDASRR